MLTDEQLYSRYVRYLKRQGELRDILATVPLSAPDRADIETQLCIVDDALSLMDQERTRRVLELTTHDLECPPFRD